MIFTRQFKTFTKEARKKKINLSRFPAIFIPFRGVKNLVQKAGEQAVKRTLMDTPTPTSVAGISGTPSAPTQGMGDVGAQKPAEMKNTQTSTTVFQEEPKSSAKQDTKNVSTLQTKEGSDPQKQALAMGEKPIDLIVSKERDPKNHSYTYGPALVYFYNEHYQVVRSCRFVNTDDEGNTRTQEMLLGHNATSTNIYSEHLQGGYKEVVTTTTTSVGINLQGEAKDQKIGPATLTQVELCTPVQRPLDNRALNPIVRQVYKTTDDFDRASYKSVEDVMKRSKILVRNMEQNESNKKE